MGMFSMAFAGGSFILIGVWESLSLPSIKTHHFSNISLISASSLSLLFIINTLISLLDAFKTSDKLGFSLQLQILSISSLFLLFSILGLFTNLSKFVSFPYLILDLILFFAFLEEFLFFYLHLKDPNGVENRYFDLMLVPILVCVVSTLIELKYPDSDFARLGRGVGLILQGTWFVQMGFCFFTDFVPNNCVLRYKSRGNYSIKCKGHMDLHRGGAIAVLLFNCHLALLVGVICVVYSVLGRRLGGGGGVEYRKYRPIGGVGDGGVLRGQDVAQFSLDSDEEGGGGVERSKDEERVGDGLRSDNVGVELVVNGYDPRSHQ